jgi:hypothetical protein
MARFLNKKFSLLLIALLIVGGFFVFGTNQASADTTGSLIPTGNGNYTSWTNDYTDVNETTITEDSCSGGDYVYSGTTGNRESFSINISSVPDGATITSVDITTWDRGHDESGPGGTYQTFTRLNGTDVDSGVNLSVTGHNGACTGNPTQTINVADTVKSGATTLEIGVLKTATDTSIVRVGAIRAVITYTIPTATIRVTKVTLPANDTTLFSITASSVDGGVVTAPATRATLATNNAEDFTVTANKTYSVSEPASTGWTQTGNTCVGLSPTAGATVDCTITNTKMGHLVVQKTTAPTPDETPFPVSITGTGTVTGKTDISITDAIDGDFEVTPGTYSVTENLTDLPVWYQNSNDCEDVVVGAGETVYCTITNTKYGSITVHKEVMTPDGYPTQDDHTFTIFRDGSYSQYINGGGSVGYFNLPPGDYTITEEVDGNYDFMSFSQDSDPETSGAQITVAPGQDVNLTITNKQKWGHLTVNKQVVNHDIGTADANDFLFSLDDGDTWTNFTAEEGSTNGQNIIEVAPGTYMVTEDGLQGYAGTYVDSQDEDCGNINIASNGSATCTITNSDIPTGQGAITVRKNLPNDNGGTATTADFPLWITAIESSPMSVLSGQPNFLTPDTYIVSETNPGQISGYTESISCTDGETTITNGTIALSAQTAWVCTITNDDQPATLYVYKHVNNNNRGTKTAGDFSFQLTHNQITGDPVVFEECDGPTYGCKTLTLDAGTYSVTEPAVDGYDTSYSYGESENCNDIVIANGGSASCYITNNDQPAGLQIIKNTDNGDDGTFDFSITDIDPDHEFGRSEQLTTVEGSASTDGYIKLNAATYDVTESVPEGWTLSSVLCNYGETQSVGEPITNGKRIVVGNGDLLTCTFNNTKRVITYHWSTTSWGSCSASCGGGTQTRTVVCQDDLQQTVDDQLCGTGKPTASQECNTQSCGGGGGGGSFVQSPCVSIDYYDWQTTCVNGVQFRDIKTLMPEGCQMTQAQRDAGQRPCSATGGQVLGEKIVGELAAGGICDDAPSIATGQVDSMLDLMKVKRNLLSEKNAQDRYIKKLLSLAKDKKLSQQNINAMINYVAYSGPRSLYLGEGERAGVLHSYLAAFGHLPRTEDEWCDAVKIATGRWTVERSDGSEKYAQDAFKSKVYKRDPKMDDQVDQNAVMVMSYGLRPSPRSLEKESLAAKIFKGILKRLPQGARDWDMVRAIAYSGAEQ